MVSRGKRGGEPPSSFLGTYHHAIDDKGRLVLPSPFRPLVGSRVVLSGGFEGCLQGFPEADFRAFVAKEIERKSAFAPDARKVSRFFHGTAAVLDVDRQGRCLIPPTLRNRANLDGEAVIVGAGSRFEVWNRVSWEKYLAEAGRDLETLAASISSEYRV